MERQKITALIPCYNEEANIEDCLKSVLWSDEILVVDSFSTDRTLEIARQFDVRILEHVYENSAAQKNWAIPQASHEWVLVVDSDERITAELQKEIEDILQNGTSYSGFRIGRANHFLGKPVRYCGWQNDRCLRLFLRDKGRYQDREVHADIMLDGVCGSLKNKMTHYTFRSFDQYMGKFHTYTSRAAIDRGRRTKRVRWHHLTLRPMFRFFKQYVLKRGFLDGRTGLILCGLAAFSVFLKYAKLWERQECGDGKP